ncbi:putative ABC transport system permease protein [Nocardioides zeae]|uniref:ABC transport system permease protein n=2 Tax=Nocardioides zeae TaxID=1457234 RepID=A0AAJ1X1K9_9ACTN|nr:ABC transporter permease [Nocardioides zeae]MDQ1103524.1 putative ABC transport system permease protein [Nocardioides zeae]MDR6172756.1 putative ABC transport system permease protein [Nocardioides zeae]MDR6209766.1 putative ABC transport system permease protein [Nocardioides zeae]
MVEPGWPLAFLVTGLAAAAALVVRLSALGPWRAPAWAATRAVVQLTLVSLLIGLVLRSMAATLAFVLLMVAVATLTAGRRITDRRAPSPWLVVPITAGMVPTVVAAVAVGAVPFEPVAVLPVAGILVGGAMTATTLAGRRITDELRDHRDLYEGVLALGGTRRQAVGVVGRPAAALGLVPGLDQTRTVGLVTLPGAFVGVLLAGASPVQAGAAQVLVLVGLLLVQSVAAAVLVELVAAGRLPVDGAPLAR